MLRGMQLQVWSQASNTPHHGSTSVTRTSHNTYQMLGIHASMGRTATLCAVVTAYDFESGCAGSNLEWGLIYYKASITAQGLPESSSLRGSTLGTPYQSS